LKAFNYIDGKNGGAVADIVFLFGGCAISVAVSSIICYNTYAAPP
jgi:NifU-like protein involved in Fe-S cluster formation